MPRRLGPFRITAVDETLNNYTLELPWSLRIHNTFHRSLLTCYKNPEKFFPTRPSSKPIQVSYSPDVDYEVEKILGHRLLSRKKQYLKSWKGYGYEHNSWEPATGIYAEELIHL